MGADNLPAMFALLLAGWLVGTAQAAGPPSSAPDPVEPPLAAEPAPVADPDPGADPDPEGDLLAPESEPAQPVEVPRPFTEALADAKSRYFLGRVDEAAAILDELRIRLAAGERVATESKAETLVYLGEIRHLQGDDAAARALFRELLLDDPDQPVSPYEHPMAVIGLFETVRTAVRTELQRPEGPPMVKKRLPAWGYLPFGVPQFAQRKPAAGAVFAGAQALTLAVSIGMFVDLDRCRVPNWDEASCGRRDDALDTLRYGIQWPSTLAFYGLWALSAVDGSTTWSREAPEVPARARRRRPQALAAPTLILPRRDGATVVFSGRF